MLDAASNMTDKTRSSSKSNETQAATPSLFKQKKSLSRNSSSNSPSELASPLPELTFTNKDELLMQIAQVGTSIQRGHVELKVP